MPATCFAMVRGSVVRITRLDAQGRILAGPRASLVTDGVARVRINQKVSESQGFRQSTPDGGLRVYLPATPELPDYDAEITLVGTDPDAVEMLTGSPVVTNSAGDIVGFESRVRQTQQAAFALEVWAHLADPVMGYNYAYTVFPFLKGGRLGGFSFGEGAVTFTVRGARIKRGSKWARGPYVLNSPGVSGWDGGGWDGGGWDVAPSGQACTPYRRAPWATSGWDGGPWDESPWDDGADGAAAGWDGGDGWDEMPWDAPVLGVPYPPADSPAPYVPPRLLEPITRDTIWRTFLTPSKPTPSCGAQTLSDVVEGNDAELSIGSVEPTAVLDNGGAPAATQIVDTMDGGAA